MRATHHRYEIRVTGLLGDMILSAFPDLHAEAEHGQTVLSGSLPDQSALYGVVARLESLGLDLVDIRRLPPDCGVP
jgi:hypothetical protein